MKTTYGQARVKANQTSYLPIVSDLRKQGAILIDLINAIPFPPDENVVEEAEFFDLKRRAMDYVEIAVMLAEKSAHT